MTYLQFEMNKKWTVSFRITFLNIKPVGIGMNTLKFLLVFGLIVILIFGCTSQSNSGDADSSSGNNGPNASGSPDNSFGDSDLPPDTGSGSDDLSGMAYGALIGLGIPLECDITTTYESETTTMKVYMKDSETMLMEVDVSSQNPECGTSLVMVKDNVAYMSCTNGPIFLDCDWYSVEMETTSGDATETYTAPDFSSVPSSDINCVPWTYDESKFATSGEVCTMEDLIAGYAST
jgi:hypothetical protein